MKYPCVINRVEIYTDMHAHCDMEIDLPAPPYDGMRLELREGTKITLRGVCCVQGESGWFWSCDTDKQVFDEPFNGNVDSHFQLSHLEIPNSSRRELVAPY